MKYRGYFILVVFLVVILSANCASTATYEEIPSMLNILTNKAQSALEQGQFEKGEQAVIDYIRIKNPNVVEWFVKNNYKLRLGVIGDYAVVVVCDKGRPIFEDTYCNPGYPDKDHRGNKNLKLCEITMTIEEVKNFCQ